MMYSLLTIRSYSLDKKIKWNEKVRGEREKRVSFENRNEILIAGIHVDFPEATSLFIPTPNLIPGVFYIQPLFDKKE